MEGRIRIHLFTAVFLLCYAGIGSAQVPETHAGIGISLDPARLILAGSYFYSNALTPVNVYLPITGPHFRVEPDVGFFSYTNQSSAGTSNSETDASIFHIGTGAFYVISMNTPVRVYVGPRLGFNFVSSKSSSTTQYGQYSSEAKGTDFIIGINVDGEYLSVPQFSVGGEAQLNYISLGKPDVTTTPATTVSGPESDVTRHVISSMWCSFSDGSSDNASGGA